MGDDVFPHAWDLFLCALFNENDNHYYFLAALSLSTYNGDHASYTCSAVTSVF